MKISPPHINRVSETAPQWLNRHDMVNHALARALPFLACVHATFSLMVLLRFRLMGYDDATILTARELIPVIDMLMYVVLAGVVMLVVLSHRKMICSPHFRIRCQVVLLLLSAAWSFSAFVFTAFWHLPFAFPLSVTLLLSTVVALYFHLSLLLCFVLPLWFMSFSASLYINQGINARILLIWGGCTLIFIYSRWLLVRWFNEAWQRYNENQLLVSRLDTMAHQDALTQTANRRALEDHLQHAVAQQIPFSIIILDVDYFKRYNDNYGHQAGDKCLANVADALKSAVRTPEDLVARYGGEEFVIVLPHASQQDTERVAQRIQQCLAEKALPHEKSEVSGWVTVSMGLANSENGKNANEIIATADAALYRAKQSGRNRWAY